MPSKRHAIIARGIVIIALFFNIHRRETIQMALAIVEFLNHHDIAVVAEEKDAAQIGAQPLSEEAFSTVDFVITLGGDGTILRLLHFYPGLQAPILAVNMGSLGFMADVPVQEIYPTLSALIEGRHQVQERLMIEGSTADGHRCYAANEIVVHRGSNPSLVELAIHIDDRYLSTLSADGLIIATPSGSTAYSLAAGGPILSPEINALVITPVSPHTISQRPVVLLPKQIQIQHLGPSESVEVTADGFPVTQLSSGKALQIAIAERRFRLVNMAHHDYFATLRSKLGLGWSHRLAKS